MTLRMTVEIVPFGNEDGKYEIFVLDISNTGLIRNEGFGHQVCSYEYNLYKPIPDILKDGEDGEDYDTESTGTIPEHDRRDGSLELIRKVLEDIENVG